MNAIIAVGALGGSGTRAVAQVLIESGVYMGDDLNRPNDNLIFTRLFKNPKWYKNSRQSLVNMRLAILKEYMGNDTLTLKNATELVKAAIYNPTFTSNYAFYLKVIRKILNDKKDRKLWGWKEPNTHIYIQDLINYFDNFKYIHVLRHGLDMAFSKNKQQLYNWGYKYNICLNGIENEDEVAYNQLVYWIKSTQEVLEKSQALGDNFLLLNHSTFCEKPKEQIKRIIDFLGFEKGREELAQLASIPNTPSTLNRYRHFNIEIFDKEQIEFVKEMDFKV